MTQESSRPVSDILADLNAAGAHVDPPFTAVSEGDKIVVECLHPNIQDDRRRWVSYKLHITLDPATQEFRWHETNNTTKAPAGTPFPRSFSWSTGSVKNPVKDVLAAHGWGKKKNAFKRFFS